MPTYTGTSASETITGSNGDDTITGGRGNDILNGLDGNDLFAWVDGDDLDTVNGGLGNDTQRMQWLATAPRTRMHVHAAGATAIVDAGAGVRGDPLEVLNQSQGVENLQLYFGSNPPLRMTLTIDDLSGTSMTGSIVINATGLESLDLQANGATTSIIALGGTSGDTLRGGLGNDQLFGYGGDDFLSGGAGGADTLVGGQGNDIYDLTDFRDSYVELAGQGVDTLIVGARNYHLAANVENLNIGLVGSSQGYTGIGNAADNEIVGHDGADYLIGLDGNDTLAGGSGAANTLQGGLGDDTYVVSAVGDTIIEYAGEGTDTVISYLTSYTLRAQLENLAFGTSSDTLGYGNAVANVMTGNNGRDTLYGLDGDDTLSGGVGNDFLIGGNGADRLIGGLGGDEMTGGAGADLFIYNSAAEAADLIHDFDHAQGDRIDVTAIMDALGPIGDDPFGNGVLSFQAVDFGVAGPGLYVMYDADGTIGPGAAFRLLTVLGTSIHQDSFIY